jgi:hypothetical protein
MNRRRKKSGSLLGSIAGAIMSLFTKSVKSHPDDLKKNEFSTSTQKSGIRFNKKIRDRFRSKWLKKH